MIYLFFALNFGLMIAMPLLLGRWLARRYRVGWGLFGIGATTFIASQVGHIPFNWLIQNQLGWLPTDMSVTLNLIIVALFLGLSAGIFEEGARYLMYRFWVQDARRWRQGMMLGAGHGGVEAILVGVLAAVNIAVLAILQQNPTAFPLPAAQLSQIEAVIATTFSQPWYLIMLGAVERLFAITFHLSASLLVMQVFVRGQMRWLAAAVLWHTLLNATAVFAANTWSPFVTEGLVGLLALGSLALILALRQKEGETAVTAADAAPTTPPAASQPLPLTDNALEKSKYL